MNEEIKTLDEILKEEKGYELCYHLSCRLAAKIDKQGFDSLTPEEKTFFIVHEMDCQVQNGGFHSYFEIRNVLF